MSSRLGSGTMLGLGVGDGAGVAAEFHTRWASVAVVWFCACVCACGVSGDSSAVGTAGLEVVAGIMETSVWTCDMARRTGVALGDPLAEEIKALDALVVVGAAWVMVQSIAPPSSREWGCEQDM